MDGKGLDHILIRMKDIVIILGSIGVGVAWLVGIVALPTKVEANTEDVKQIQTTQQQMKIAVTEIQTDLKYIKSTLTEDRRDIKKILEKLS